MSLSRSTSTAFVALVKNKYVGFTDDRAGEADSLALSAGETKAALTCARIEALRQGLHEVEHIGCLQCGSCVRDAGKRVRHADVIENRTLQQVDVLACDSHTLQPGCPINPRKRDSVHGNRSLLSLVQLQDKVHNRALPSATRAHQGSRHPTGDGETDGIQAGVIVPCVHKDDIAECEFLFKGECAAQARHGIRLV